MAKDHVTAAEAAALDLERVVAELRRIADRQGVRVGPIGPDGHGLDPEDREAVLALAERTLMLALRLSRRS